MTSRGGFRVYQCPCERWQVEIGDPVPIPLPRFSEDDAAVNAVRWHTSWLELEAELQEVLWDHAFKCEVLAELVSRHRLVSTAMHRVLV